MEWTFTDEKLVQLALFLTLALALATIALGLLFYKAKKDKFADFAKFAGGFFFGYAVALVAVFGYVEGVGASIVPLLLYPLLTLIIVLVLGLLAVSVAGMFDKKLVKPFALATIVAVIGAFVAIIACVSVHYVALANDPNFTPDTGLDFADVSQVGLIVTGIVFSLLIVVGLLISKNRKDTDNTKSIVYGAVSIAMAFALSYVKFMNLPQGGAVTFASLLPLIVYASMFGSRKGIIVCLIYGTMQAMQDTFIIHPMQFMLDYPLAFGLVGFSGIFAERHVFKKNVANFVAGAVLAAVLRYACHVCSGVFAFGSYAGEGYSAVAWGFLYNTFVGVDMAVVIIAGSMLFASKNFVSHMQRAIASKVVLTEDETQSNETESTSNIEVDQSVDQTVQNSTAQNIDIKIENAPNQDAIDATVDENK